MEIPATVNGSDNSKKRVYKVVLTGGPCGGKTTGQTRLCAFFENLGWKVYRNQEEAYRFLSGGISFNDLDENQAMEFQEDLLKVMIQGEDIFFRYAEYSKKNCLVIFDRGTMDALSYVDKEKWDGIMNRNNYNLVELRDNRYHQIIHMVSAACGAEDFYSSIGHATRHENVENARKVDRRTAEAWVGHPYIDVIDNSTDFEMKIKRMINSVCQKMGIDTGDRLEHNSKKLKFLVKSPIPDDSVFPAFQDFTVEHVYLRSSSKKMQTRLRKRGIDGVFSYTQTIRMPEKLGQIVEVKTATTDRVWKSMQAMADNHHFKIFKTRKCFLHNNQYFQLDIYQKPCHSRCEGLIFLETYSALSPGELKLRIPSFLNNVEDVTGKPEYSMFNLSLKDEWKNSEKFCHNIADSGDSEEDENDLISAADFLDSPVATIHLCPQFDNTDSYLRSVQTQTSAILETEDIGRYIPFNGMELKLR